MNRAMKDAILLLFFGILVGGLGYVTRFVLANHLSVEEYGLFYAVYSFVFLFAPFREIGLSEAGVFFINKFRVENNLRKIKSILLICIYSQLFVTIFFFTLMVIFKDALVIYYFENSFAGLVLIVVGLIFLLDFSTPLIGHFFLAYEKIIYFRFTDVIKNAVIIASLFFIFSQTSLTGASVPAIAFLMGSAIAFLIISSLFFIKFSDILKSSTFIERKTVSEVFVYSLPILLASASTLILSYSGTILLTLLSSVESVGIYNVAYPAAFLIILLISPIYVIVFPKVARFHHMKKNEEIKSVLEMVYSNAAIFILPLIMVFVVYSDIIINVFFSSKFIAANVPFKIFSLAAFFIFLWEFNANILVATGQVKERLKLILSVSLANILLGIVLILLFDVTGAAITAFICLAVMGVVSVRILVKKYGVNINFWEQIKILLSSLVFMLSTYVLKRIFDFNVYFEIFVVLVFSGLVYLIALYLFRILGKQRIKLFKELIFK